MDMETDNNNPKNNQLSVVCQKKRLIEIYKDGNNDLSVIEQIAILPNKSFFDVVYQSKKIKDLKYDQYFSGHIGVILLKICALAGIKSVIDDFTKRDIINMLFTRFNQLSTADVWKAFELERYGAYDVKSDHFQLFDTNYISEVLKKYIEWVRKEKTMINYVPPSNENIEISEMTDSSKKDIMTKAILKSFEHFLISGSLPSEPQEHIYEELRERGFIKSISIHSEYYKNQYEKALTQVKNDLNKKMLTDFSFRDFLKQKIKDIENGNDGAVLVQMKRNILCDFFEKYRTDSSFIGKLKK